MAFTVYQSTDAGAPVLNGTTGTLINVFDACLVNGYGSQSSMGWTKAFTSGSNFAAYRMYTGAKFYLRINDSAPVVANEARTTGYESMTDVNTGTGSFPVSNGTQAIRKSSAANSTAIPWILFGDQRTFYFFTNTGDIGFQDSVAYYPSFGFGAFYSLLPGDNYNCFLSGRSLENRVYNDAETLPYLYNDGTAAGLYVPRSYLGTGTAVNMSKFGDSSKSYFSVTQTNIYGGEGVVPLPNPPDGDFMLSPIWIMDNTTAPTKNIRGRMRGLWQWLHPSQYVGDRQTLVGTGDLAGKTFMVIKNAGNKLNGQLFGNQGVFIVETSDTLET